MCTRYVSPEAAAIERHWRIGSHNPWRGKQREVFPSYQAPFIRADRLSTEPRRELVVGQWNLIPWFAKEAKLKYATCSFRRTERQGQLQAAVGAGTALHHPCCVVL